MESYDSILKRMSDKYTELSGNTPAEASDISVRLRVLAGEIYSAYVNMEWLKRQLFADTAQGEYLELHAKERGLVRREASYAVGSVVFSVTEPALKEIIIPAGTVVATCEEIPLRFETVETVSIPVKGTSVHSQIKALETGRKYNVSAEKICILVTPPAGVETVTNPDPCTSGTDTESDESLRARVIDSYKFASNGTNCAYYKNVASEIVGVAGAGVIPKGRGAGTVDVYISGEGGEVSDEVLDEVQKKLSNLREVNVDVAVYKADAENVNLLIYLDVEDGYEFSEVKENCLSAIEDYISTRGVGGSVLLNHITDILCHTQGVRDFYMPAGSNFNIRCPQNRYPVIGNIRFTEGVS